MATPQALEGVRILDLSGGIAGPLGVLQLAEHGADVIKIEPPGGRPDRTTPASRAHNRSRRSMTVDLHDPAGAALFRELCSTADVLVEAFAPGTMAELGLDYPALSGDFPRLVYCSVPAWPAGVRYGDTPGYEALVHARTGQQWEVTSFRPGPVFLHSPVASLGAAYLVPVGIMSALLARDRTGRGQHVEVSLLQGAMSLTTQIWNWTDRGQFMLDKRRPPGIHQATIFECARGEWVHTTSMSGTTPTRSEAEILGIADINDRTARQGAYRRWDRGELIEAFRAAGLCAEAIGPPHEKLSHPQLIGTGAVAKVQDPDLGELTQVGVTLYLGATPGAVRGPQPRAGEHTDELLGELGYDHARIDQLRTRGVV